MRDSEGWGRQCAPIIEIEKVRQQLSIPRDDQR